MLSSLLEGLLAVDEGPACLPGCWKSEPGKRAFKDPEHSENDDFVQAGALYQVMGKDERERLISNIAGSLAQVARDDVIEQSISHFAKADDELGERLTAETARRRASK